MCARGTAALEAAAEHIRQQYKVDVLSQTVDVTNADAVHGFVEAVVSRFGAVDICITNSGGPPAKGFLAASVEDWRKAIDSNFLSTVYFAREVIPHMQKKRWGRIITITSITTKQPVSDLVLSNAVRAGVVGLVKSLANEFGKDGILVNNVGPGFTAHGSFEGISEGPVDRLGKVAAGDFRRMGGGCCPEAHRRTPRGCGHDCMAGFRARLVHHRADNSCRRGSLQGAVTRGWGQPVETTLVPLSERRLRTVSGFSNLSHNSQASLCLTPDHISPEPWGGKAVDAGTSLGLKLLAVIGQ